MKHVLLLLAVATTVTLAACGSGREAWNRRCAEYGFKPGTVEMSQCLQNEYLAYRNRLAVLNADDD